MSTQSTSKTSFASWLRHGFLKLYLRQLRRIWRHLPSGWAASPLGKAYGKHVDRIVHLASDRQQYFATFFLRNRPELELLVRLIDRKPHGARLDMTILACSKGAEVYSMAWAIRSARPDLQLHITAVDISPQIVEFAKTGVYSLSRALDSASTNAHPAAEPSDAGWNTFTDQNAWIFERVSPEEMASMFDVNGEEASVRPWLREGITWLCGDASDARLAATLGPQDIVVANRFLCHMHPPQAHRCLTNIGTLVKPGGNLFVYGLDIDVRTAVARENGWTPIQDLMREIHDGDISIRAAWPLQYWSLEPLDTRRPDWQLRYASVFRIGTAPSASEHSADAELVQR